MCISIIRTLFILIRSNIWEKDLSSLRRRSLLNTVYACQCRIYRYIYIDIRFTYKFLRELFNLNFKINGKNISLHDVVLDLSVCLPVLLCRYTCLSSFDHFSAKNSPFIYLFLICYNKLLTWKKTKKKRYGAALISGMLPIATSS